MKTFREYIHEADTQGIAIGHFNISNLEALHGIYQAVTKLTEEGETTWKNFDAGKVPVIIGLTEGEENFVGIEEGVSLVRTIRETDDYPIFLNGDHHYSFETVQKALDAGYDSVIIDAVKLPLDENIILTKKCVDYARTISANILVEAELGFIGTSSKILDELPEGVSEATMTKPEDAKAFVEATGVDMLAPSVGNVHGMVKGGNPRLHPERVKEIREATGIPLVLHGGSGTMDEDFLSCIKNGIDIVHINTEIRVVYKDALIKSLIEHPDEVAPYKYLPESVTAIENVVYSRIKLFSGIK